MNDLHVSAQVGAIKRRLEEKNQRLRRLESDLLLARRHHEHKLESAKQRELEVVHLKQDYGKALKDLALEKREEARKEAALKAEEAKLNILERESEHERQTTGHGADALHNMEAEVDILRHEKAADEAELARLEAELRKQQQILAAKSS